LAFSKFALLRRGRFPRSDDCQINPSQARFRKTELLPKLGGVSKVAARSPRGSSHSRPFSSFMANTSPHSLPAHESRSPSRSRSMLFRRSAPPAPLDNGFPRAVPGEDYERFGRAMWAQGQRWVRTVSHLIAERSLSMHDARDVLRGAAATELGRALHEQEERLLGELLHAEWTAASAPR
jgi:hypothetical protein